MADEKSAWRKASIEQWPPTSWLDPIDITRTGLLTVLAGLFGSFADKRETLAALYPADLHALAFDHSEGDEIWFDYICDTGDGWNPTYSIAYLVGQDSLTVESDSGTKVLPRGAFMILGGDQVYPVASSENYRNRLEGPYFAARPQSYDKKNRIPVYALPGNHDWYDGLTSFIRLFCHKDRWVAQWTATQSRSYFALKLPHHWWVWGLDVQLESDLDVPQVDYFKRCAGQLEASDRVIIVSPEPTWIKAGQGQEADPSHRNMQYLEGLIQDRGASVPIKIAGDLHHYARYQERGGERQLITCGGGGAFLHGTYGLPTELILKEAASHEGPYQEPASRTFAQGKAVPTESQSNALRAGVICNLIKQNPWFAVAVGCIYWVYSWLVQSASEALNTLPWSAPTLLDYLRGTRACRDGKVCPGLFGAWWDVVVRDPGLFVLTGVIIGGCAAFAIVSRRASSPAWKKGGLLLLGLLHGFAHIALAIALMDALSQVVHANWIVHFMTLPTGALPGAILMSFYLLLANVLFEGHDQEVLSTQAIADYKCFARFHVTKDTVTIFPVGLEKACTEWTLADGIEPRTYTQHHFPRRKRLYKDLRVPLTVRAIFEPKRALVPRLLEPPIVVNWPKEPTGSPSRGSRPGPE